jgi:hypothetical protein
MSMTDETRPDMIRRLLDALNHQAVEIAAEAERYEDKQMDEPPAMMIALKYSIGRVVRLKLDEEGTLGHVTGATLRPQGLVYMVTWGDSRAETDHYEFELTAADDDPRLAS